jgi:hypothetical protein
MFRLSSVVNRARPIYKVSVHDGLVPKLPKIGILYNPIGKISNIRFLSNNKPDIPNIQDKSDKYENINLRIQEHKKDKPQFECKATFTTDKNNVLCFVMIVYFLVTLYDYQDRVKDKELKSSISKDLWVVWIFFLAWLM